MLSFFVHVKQISNPSLFLPLTGEKLAEEWHRNEVGLVAEVDCTSRNGKLLCEQLDIRSFPTLMYGDPGHLEEYNGGRKYEDLAEFAEENLVPLCSPTKLDLCDEDTRKQIEEYLAMSQEELSALVESEEKKLANAKKAYDEEINALQQKYEEAAKTRDEAYASVREGGMSLMKAVEKVLKLRPTPTKSIQASTDEL